MAPGIIVKWQDAQHQSKAQHSSGYASRNRIASGAHKDRLHGYDGALKRPRPRPLGIPTAVSCGFISFLFAFVPSVFGPLECFGYAALASIIMRPHPRIYAGLESGQHSGLPECCVRDSAHLLSFGDFSKEGAIPSNRPAPLRPRRCGVSQFLQHSICEEIR